MIDKKFDIAYLKIAMIWATLSHAKRKQVGAILVRNGQIISDGYNGTPSGVDNICEDEDGKTNWMTLHGESNAILKCSKHGNSCDGATLYVTYSPCRECCKLIIQSGIKRVVYYEEYRDTSGLKLLEMVNIKIEKINMINE